MNKISDFVYAAIQTAKENERLLDLKKKEQELQERRDQEKRKYKVTKVEEVDEAQQNDDEDGFTTIEDNKTRVNKKDPKLMQKKDMQKGQPKQEQQRRGD